ncbi:MAG: C4-dicarboxylate ABC transporter substrate-binding protein [Rhodobacteraceae bacterium]|nr:C4-dicarboxylate ABC transporter substrate-binding protein [Paracoccaceae bacterium]
MKTTEVAARIKGKFNGLLAATAVLALGAGSASAEEVLRAVTAFPTPMFWSQDFSKYVDKVNEKGEGIVRIDIMGGPEVFPPMQQVDAVSRGIVDIQYGPATYHLGKVPEIDALVGSNVSTETVRKNGGLDLLQGVFEEKLGVRLMAVTQSGLQFHVWTVNEPKISEDGEVDLDGMRLRSQPIYQAFFEGMNAVPVSVPVPDVYTGLERHTFEGVGWPVAGVSDFSWDKFLKYRIDPGFFNTDLVIVMNPDTFEGLSDEAKAILSEAAVEYEIESSDRLAKITAETDAAVREKGVEVITLEGEAAKAYLDTAYGSAWSRLETSGSPLYEELRAKFYD